MNTLWKSIRLREYKDKRGNLVENTLLKIMNDSRHFFISKSKPNIIRANHYHLRKSEWFYVIQGNCKIKLEDLKTHKMEEISVKDTDNIMVYIGPNIAHAFQNTGKKELILLALVNEVHDQKDPDTNPYKLL
jgi:dTDP-4-dehydrorhamnose 3,5-epimerase-like enzyme